ncbi:TolC family protein [Flavisolibacter nicotianae]|uniref:TolC family protein n=1 Tax=Flavisolibacter nicotianae TaxID=2364882 RepID=UPI000EB5B589|nr:TolC family protein [Flavisolibacter nicotianae]
MKRIVIAFFLFFHTCLFAQSNLYRLSDLLQKVETTYPSIKARQASINAANYYLQAARKDFLPDVIAGHQYQYATDNGLEGSYFSNEGTTVSTSGGMRDHNIYQPIFGSFTTLQVNWHAFDFGKVRESVKLAESRVDLAKADYANAVFQQQVRVADAYLLLVLSQKLVSVQEKNLARSKSFREYVWSHTSAGLLPGVDSSAANAEVAKAELALLQSRQFVEQQKNNLAQLSGMSADSIRIDTAYLHKIPAYVSGELAVTSNPLLDLQRKQLTTQYNQLQVLKKSVLPSVNVVGIGWARGSGIDRVTKEYSSSPGDGLAYQAYNYMAGVALKWNITSLVKNKQQYLGAAQELEATRYKMEEQSAILTREVRNAELQYQSALQQTKVAPLQYTAALDAYNLSNARYQAGLASLNEVIQAYYVLNRADVDNAVAVNNVWRALLQHVAATGSLPELTSQLP